MRRLILQTALFGVFGVTDARASDPAAEDWAIFKARHLARDGRVIDNGNQGISHSEGQGFGLLFAVAFDDRDAFDRIYGWTEENLRRPNDALHAWRFHPDQRPPVKDLNNATDGDIFIAAALARAGRRWADAERLLTAAAISRDILSMLVRQIGDLTVLLPGVDGFETDDAVTVNLSYYAFPFMAELASLVLSPQWAKVQVDGGRLIEQARYGKWQLPSDWARIARADLALEPAPDWPPRFGFDAIRIPLWQSWAKTPVGPARRSLSRFWSAFPEDRFPAWVDVATGKTADFPATPGLAAVARVTLAAMGERTQPDLPRVADSQTYYDAALILLCHLAWQTLHPA